MILRNMKGGASHDRIAQIVGCADGGSVSFFHVEVTITT